MEPIKAPPKESAANLYRQTTGGLEGLVGLNESGVTLAFGSALEFKLGVGVLSVSESEPELGEFAGVIAISVNQRAKTLWLG